MSTAAHPEPVTLVQKLAARIDGASAGPEPCAQRIPVETYTDQQGFEAERERLFLRQPVIIGHESQIPAPGDAIVQDWLGLPLITLRDKEGQYGALRNVPRPTTISASKTCAR